MCQCDWFFDTHVAYAYKHKNIYIINQKNKIDTLEWGGWLYCNQCHVYLCPNNIDFKYPVDVSLVLSFLIQDVKLHILDYYHSI